MIEHCISDANGHQSGQYPSPLAGSRTQQALNLADPQERGAPLRERPDHEPFRQCGLRERLVLVLLLALAVLALELVAAVAAVLAGVVLLAAAPLLVVAAALVLVVVL